MQRFRKGFSGQRLVAGLFIALFAFTLALIVASFPAGSYSIYFAQLSPGYSWTTTTPSPFPYVLLGGQAAAIPVAPTFGELFFACALVYAAMFAFSTRQGSSPLAALSSALKNDIGSLFSSPFVVVLISIGFLVFTLSLIDAFVPVVPPTPPPATIEFMILTYAPLAEEFSYRVLVIGSVAAVITLGRPLRDVLGALWRPSIAYGDGGAGVAEKAIVMVMLATSSVYFGYSHVASGWSSGKMVEATFGGVVLGYLYVRYGFHVAVLAHWGVDYFGQVFSFFGQASAGVPWDSPKEYFLQSAVSLDLLLLFGLACFMVVLFQGARKWASSKGPEILKADTSGA